MRTTPQYTNHENAFRCLEKGGRLKTLAPNDLFLGSADVGQIDFLIEGRLAFYATHEDGHKYLYALQSGPFPCTIFPFSIFGNQPTGIVYRVASPCQVLTVPLSQLQGGHFAEGMMATLLSSSCSHHHWCMVREMKNAGKAPLAGRLYDYLLGKARESGSMEVAVAHKIMASDLHCTREAISRAIKKLEQKNKLKRMPRYVLLSGNL